MDVGSAVNQGLIGMQRSQYEINKSAQQIAQAGTTENESAEKTPDNENSEKGDLVGNLVNIKAQTQVFNSSAKVVKAADETIGTLLNVKA